MNAFM